MSNLGVLVAATMLAAALYGAVAFSRADDVGFRFREPAAADWSTVPLRLHSAMRHCMALELEEHRRRMVDHTWPEGYNPRGAAFEKCREELRGHRLPK